MLDVEEVLGLSERWCREVTQWLRCFNGHTRGMLKTRSEKGVKRDSMSLDLVADHFRQGLQAKSLGGWVNDADVWGTPQFEFLVSRRQPSGIGAESFAVDVRWIVSGRMCWHRISASDRPVESKWEFERRKSCWNSRVWDYFRQASWHKSFILNLKILFQCHDRGNSEGQWHVCHEIERTIYLMMLWPAKLLMALLVDLEKSLFRWLALEFRSPQSWTTKRAVMELWAWSFVR